ncbi:hypothetical protein LY624_16010 [Pseudoalteromonas sp. N1230-9]|uniref:hypothetical protein n=1 Tax=unclassified Pseudoalteromonas TaxID=194690 RepID=UPI001022BCAA|nr:hypothetical protein EXT42_00445 [Pseudoalteromonas sp. CO302Y]RZG11760.1 hypothetical protein EXT40_00445 [Pseudoalteromonas sp. CO133X]WOC26049.1 hypothetical protein LY624_16010 [Pseudoalteromonas sp. N1230-9]
MSLSNNKQCHFIPLAIVLFLLTGFAYGQDEQCTVQSNTPSAKVFYRFIKKFKAEDLLNGETLLKSNVQQLDCQPVFKVKIVNRSGDVSHRYYQTDTFELILDDSKKQWDPINRVFQELDKLVGDKSSSKEQP